MPAPGDSVPESGRLIVRPARPADVDEVARIQLDTWRIGYERFLPPAVLDQLTLELARSSWAAAIGAPPSPRHHVLVAQEHDWTVGFAALGPDDDDDDDSIGTIATLLVEPRWGRRGHGSRLLAAATDHLRGDGFGTVTTWIYDRDQPSRNFFTSAGWAPDGLARTLDADGSELREIRLHTEL
ncbi:MAG TPA: GNAT family N-acetyltransferase [Mycobacteriales bacterium]|nr:GNAT family N-acetyltransferase [Mycobacteriales bacterium]